MSPRPMNPPKPQACGSGKPHLQAWDASSFSSLDIHGRTLPIGFHFEASLTSTDAYLGLIDTRMSVEGKRWKRATLKLRSRCEKMAAVFAAIAATSICVLGRRAALEELFPGQAAA